MDRNTIRERLLSGFKPKTKDIATPYLEDLDGELMLQGLTGKQTLDLNEQATEQILASDGTATNKVNARKLACLRIQACLCVRSTGEPVYSLVDVLGENGDGNGAILELDDVVFQKLVSTIHEFLGGKSPLPEVKKSSEQTSTDSASSSSPQGSAEPLTNSSDPSIAQS